MSDTPLPYEAVLNAPATAVLALIAVVVVGALVLLLRSLVSRKSSGCEEEHARIWKEIDTLRVRSHEQANKTQEALMLARKHDKRAFLKEDAEE